MHVALAGHCLLHLSALGGPHFLIEDASKSYASLQLTLQPTGCAPAAATIAMRQLVHRKKTDGEDTSHHHSPDQCPDAVHQPVLPWPRTTKTTAFHFWLLGFDFSFSLYFIFLRHHWAKASLAREKTKRLYLQRPRGQLKGRCISFVLPKMEDIKSIWIL